MVVAKLWAKYDKLNLVYARKYFLPREESLVKRDNAVDNYDGHQRLDEKSLSNKHIDEVLYTETGANVETT